MAKKNTGMTSRKEAVDIAVMAQDIKYIKENLEETVKLVNKHETYITQAKTVQGLVKWSVGSGWLLTLGGFLFLLMKR